MHQCQFLEEFRRTCSKDNDAEWQTNHPPSWFETARRASMWASLRRINFLRLGGRSHSTLILSPSKDKGGP